MVCGDPGNIQTEAQIATQIVAGSPIIGWIIWQGKALWKNTVENCKYIYNEVWQKKKSHKN